MNESVPAESFREEKDRTYSTFAHPHRLRAPFVADGTLELEEPRMCQISQPPIGRVLDRKLSNNNAIVINTALTVAKGSG